MVLQNTKVHDIEDVFCYKHIYVPISEVVVIPVYLDIKSVPTSTAGQKGFTKKIARPICNQLYAIVLHSYIIKIQPAGLKTFQNTPLFTDNSHRDFRSVGEHLVLGMLFCSCLHLGASTALCDIC